MSSLQVRVQALTVVTPGACGPCFLEVLLELDTGLCVSNPLHYSNRKVYYDDQILKFGT